MNPNLPAQQTEYSVIERLVVNGDLSGLNDEQRITYYNQVCKSLGLNPFTKPFDYIVLNGKLTLYARKDCTEQLRKLNGISILKLEGNIVDDLYIVKASASDKSGRTDEAIGAVSLTGFDREKRSYPLKGDAKANAIMKAETKAKRRVTLSISGLGWADESEIETIPNAVANPVVNSTTVEIVEQKPVEISPQVEPLRRVTKEESEEIDKILLECDLSFQARMEDYLRNNFNTESFEGLSYKTYTKMRKMALENRAATQIQPVEAVS